MADLITYHGDSKVIGRICELLNSMTGVSFRKVQTLPQTGESNVIYLVPKSTSETDNVFDEYIWIDNDWELIGTTEIDLSNYYTKTEVDNLIPTDFVPKSTGGTFEGDVTVEEKNTGTTNVDSYLTLGNAKATGTLGCTRGVLEIYGGSAYRTRIFHTSSSRPTTNRIIYLPDKDGTFAITDDIPDELSDLSDDSTHRLVTDTEKTTWNGKSDTDENVKQIFTDNTNTNFYLLGSNSDSQGDETNSVKKIAHAYFNGNSGNLTIRRKHTATSLNNNIVTVGNDIPEGTSGNVSGILRLYGKGAYYGQFYDGYNALTGNQTYRFRNATGVLGLLADVTNYAVSSFLGDLNLMNPPYFHTAGGYPSGNPTLNYSTNEDTGEYTVKGSDTSNRALNFKRYTQGFYLPSGRYKMSGCPNGGSSSTYSIRVYKATESGTTTGIGNDYGSGFEFTLTERTLMQIVFYVNANQNVDLTFRPKLERLKDFVLMSENLNDIVESGDYLGGSGNSCTNKPTGITEFGLTVLKTGTSSCKQTLTQPSGTEYVRFNNNGTWGNWTQL